MIEKDITLQIDKLSLDKIDIEILFYLFSNKKSSSISSSDIKEIIEHFSKHFEVITPCYSTIYKRIQKMIQADYLSKGYKLGKMGTFFILKKGIDFINENIPNENIYEDSEIIENINESEE